MECWAPVALEIFLRFGVSAVPTTMCGIPSKAHKDAKARKESYENNSIIRN
jgi:hypothetical protein